LIGVMHHAVRIGPLVNDSSPGRECGEQSQSNPKSPKVHNVEA